MKNEFKHMSRKERENLLAMVFGPWKERAELNAILFPNIKNGKSTFPGPCGLVHGKSADVIEAALKIVLSVDPMAGEPNMVAFGKDKAGKDEFRTDIAVFAANASKYLAKHSMFVASQTIARAAKAIVSLAGNLKKGEKGRKEARAAMGVLWCGIAASLESMENIPFTLLRNLCKPLGAAVSASSNLCKAEIEAFHAAADKHSAVLWRHAVFGPAEARESFRIFGVLTGKRPDAGLVEDFCGAFPSGKFPSAPGRFTPTQPKRPRRIPK